MFSRFDGLIKISVYVVVDSGVHPGTFNDFLRNYQILLQEEKLP